MPLSSASRSSSDAPETPRRAATVWAEVLLPLGLIAGLVVLLSLNVEPSAPTAEPASALEAWLRTLVGYLAGGAEIAAAGVIGVGIARAVFHYARRFFQRGAKHVDATERIRLQLGRVLALGLEFTLASDILRTAVAPTRQDILNLGAIVLLRTLLNYFLEREIRTGEARREEAEGGQGAVTE